MRASPPSLLPAFAAAGFAAIAAQVLLLRELLVCAAGDEAAIGAGLCAWLLGIALGAAARRRGAPGPVLSPAALLSLLAGAGGAGVVALRLLRVAAAPPAGELPGLGLVLFLASVSLLPSGALVGASFAALGAHAATLLPPGEALARLYVVGVDRLARRRREREPPRRDAPPAPHRGPPRGARGRPPPPRLGPPGTAARPRRRGPARPRVRRLPPARPGDGAAPLRIPLAGGAARRGARHAPRAPRPRRRPAAALGERRLLRDLPRPVRERDARPPRRLARPVAAPRPRARGGRAGSCSASSSGTLPSASTSSYRTRSPSPSSATGCRARTCVPSWTRASASCADDPRRFLSRTREEWDLILLLGPDPVTLGRARLLTEESFRAASARLAPRGALVVSLRTASAAMTGATAALGGSVFGALRAAFPVVRATPGPDTLLVAGFDGSAVTLDPAVVAARFRARRIASDSFVPELFPLFLEPGNVARVEAALADASRRVPPSRDDRPVSLLFALARRQRETSSLFGRPLGALARLPAPLLAALVLLPSAALAVRGLVAPAPLRRAALHAAAATGAGGMALSFLLLLSFQTREGALYGALGALTAAFMLGLAAGAAGSHRLVASLSPSPRPALLSRSSPRRPPSPQPHFSSPRSRASRRSRPPSRSGPTPASSSSRGPPPVRSSPSSRASSSIRARAPAAPPRTSRPPTTSAPPSPRSSPGSSSSRRSA